MSDILSNACLEALHGMRLGPKPLLPRMVLAAEEVGAEDQVSLELLSEALRTAAPSDTFRREVHLALARWDASAEAPWIEETEKHTQERRQLIYGLLKLDKVTAATLHELFPPAYDGTIVISETFTPWYTAERRAQGCFYWPAYERYLLDMREWDPEAVSALDGAATSVVERLADPLSPEAYQSKGLVVGYVQSGKTANINGVIAKAIDGGYRLIIVMTGTVELLRQQTQRRVDMELVGKENILRGVNAEDKDLLASVDYQDDRDWETRFISYGELPSALGNWSDIHRLTAHRWDYRSLKAGIGALEFASSKVNRTRPLFDPVNLPSAATRLVVVKKNGPVLRKLVADLRRIVDRLGEIPTLIIDDESDQASVNTSNPKSWSEGQRQRTSINGLISELLVLLPRAQYVGYTATPFANVFVDPEDVENIFPKDFIIALDQPAGYMGVRHFHDFDDDLSDGERTVANSAELAHVRPVVSQTPAERATELQQALDAFVLSGALKLYREALGNHGTFRSHTMLVHESVKKADHRDLAEDVREVWAGSAYSQAVGADRLRTLFTEDFLPVSRARPDGPMPESFDELRPFIADSITRITSGGDPVIVVNSDADLNSETVDFDRRGLWRILIGGAKLSRGFTIEGLTVSWYRRRTKQADTLMQMGRWFGFRNGYRDLVRLYIGRREPDGASTMDLYEAFEAIMRDEEAFRDQLALYAKPVEGQPQITPMQVPPLVTQHLPWLRPTSPNKMFNSVLTTRTPAKAIELGGHSERSEDLAHNYDVLLPLFQGCKDEKTLLTPRGSSTYRARIGIVPHHTLVAALAQTRWITEDYFAPDLAFLQSVSGDVDDWALILPQPAGAPHVELPGLGSTAVLRRKRTRGPKFQNMADPKHRHAIYRLGGLEPPYGDDVIESLKGPRRGGALLYFMWQHETTSPVRGRIVPAFAVVAPREAIKPGPLVTFTVRNKSQRNAVVVDASAG